MMEDSPKEWTSGYGRDDCVYPFTFDTITYYEGCVDDYWCATVVEWGEMADWEYCSFKEGEAADAWRKDIDEWQWEYNIEQSDHCYWICETQECNDIYSFTENKPDHCWFDKTAEFCFDTCYPELSRCEIQSEFDEYLQPCEQIFYDQDVWENVGKYFIADWAHANKQQRVYTTFSQYHEVDHSYDSCSVMYKCDWELCDDELVNENEDVCWMEECYNDCGDEVCKVWHAYEYNYDIEQWMWDIEECPMNVDEVYEDAEEFVGDVDFMAFNNTLSLLNSTFLMDSNQAPGELLGSAAAGEVDPDVKDFDVNGLLDMFYGDRDAQNITRTFLNDAEVAFDIDR